MTVKCFRLGNARKRGVISGVPLPVYEKAFKKMEGVCEARRMTRWRDRNREDKCDIRGRAARESTSVVLVD